MNLIHSSYAYSGHDFSIVQDDSIVLIAGNQICIWNSSSNKKDYIVSKRYGYSLATANYHKGYIAACEYGLSPEVHVYKYPGKELVTKFKADTTVQCMDMCFSRDGKYLLIVGGLPDFKLSIFDLENNKKLQISDKIPCPKNYKKIKFNPGNSKNFAIMSTNSIYFYTIFDAYEIQQQSDQQELSPSERVNYIEYKSDNPELSFTSFIWDHYARVHVCTDLPILLQVDSYTANEENQLSLPARPLVCIMTQKHMIVSTEDCYVFWYKLNIPVLNFGVEISKEHCLKVVDEIDQEFFFENDGEPIAFMHYSRSFKKILLGTEKGRIGSLAVEAEANNEDAEEEEDQQNEKEQKKIESNKFSDLGRFHTKKVTGIRELGETTQLVTISEDLTLAVWEACTCTQHSKINLFYKPTALSVSTDGKVAFVGSDGGVLRVYDVSNRAMPRLLKQYKFYDGMVINTVCSSNDGKFVIVSALNSDQLFILSQKVDDEFEVYGHIVLEGYILNSCFTIQEGQLRILAVLSNNLLAGMHMPLKRMDNKREPIPDSITKTHYRKIDRGINLVMSNIWNGDIFVCGEDKYLKKMEFPNEPYSKMDFKKPPNAPLEEHKSHDLLTTCWDYTNDFKFMATGGKDGAIILRNMNHVEQNNPIKAHAVFSGGITALSFSNTRSMLYTAGGDGVFLAWSVGKSPNPPQPILNNKPDIEAIDKIDAIQDDDEDANIMAYKDILLNQFYVSQEPQKEAFKEGIMYELNAIKSKLNELLEENERVTDIEKLNRDEFVIDVEKQEQVVADGEKVCQDIRNEAEKTTLKLELIKDRVQQTTWDKMEVQSKAIKSIKGDMLVFNYAIRKKTKEEQRRSDQMQNFRRMEIREKISRMETKINEILDENDFSKIKEQYFMNRVNGRQDYIEDATAAEAAQQFVNKEMEKKSKKEKEEAKLKQQAGTLTLSPGKRVPTLKITKGKLGQKTKKKGDDDDMKDKGKDKLLQREIKGMEEMFWRIQFLFKNLEDLKASFDKMTIWDMIYESYDLYTAARKRIQIELLKDLIIEIKKEYNKEFDSLELFKENQIFFIKEKNEQIKELLNNLKQEEEIFEPQSHILENPNSIFEIDEATEIKVVKVLTKEDQARVDEERKRKEERERAMQGDNVQQRGLKNMMGGTELNLKKDQNVLEADLVREDWMNKPQEEMNEDEKQKMKEFEQKEKEIKEKKKKAWEQDLKKIRGDIIELQLKFEERMTSQFKRKLFYDVRIFEQELYIIRLTIMLHDAKETAEDEVKYKEEREKLEVQLKEKEELISRFYNEQKILDDSQRDNQMIQEQERELKKQFTDVNIKNITSFVRQGGKSKKKDQNEPSAKEQELMSKIVDLDPFSEIDKSKIKKLLEEEESKEIYNFEKDNTMGLSEEMFDRLVQQRYMRIEYEKDKQKLIKKITSLKEHVTYLEGLRGEIYDKFQQASEAFQKSVDRIDKLKHNFEIVVYLKQGQVEVPQLPVATDYKDAILIRKGVIEDENGEIVRRGDAKVDLMEKISEFKTGLKRVRYQKKKLDLEIVDFEERAKDVQLYRVTKQTQEIIQGKHKTKDEEDKKRLENQIKQLEDNAQKRIKQINETKKKLKKEIREKNMENEQLETKARQLQQNVDQREQIMGLKSKTGDAGVADPKKKIKEIAHKRKLLDIAKQQTEEIEFLRDELDRLRARTFPSFAHLQNKPEYPDEN